MQREIHDRKQPSYLQIDFSLEGGLRCRVEEESGDPPPFLVLCSQLWNQAVPRGKSFQGAEEGDDLSYFCQKSVGPNVNSGGGGAGSHA